MIPHYEGFMPMSSLWPKVSERIATTSPLSKPPNLRHSGRTDGGGAVGPFRLRHRAPEALAKYCEKVWPKRMVM